MDAITILITGSAAEKLRDLAQIEQRSETEIVQAALEAYAPRKRPLPKGTGKYRSGRQDTSKQVDEILKDAVQEGQWP